MNKFFITTAIDYTNDVVHIGHSYQKILADSLARYHRLIGDNTFFLTGTDEHGQKVESSAKEAKISPKKFVDQISEKDKKEWKSLNISYDRFIRTTDPDHVKFAQEVYLKAKKNGDIYLSKYEGLYCEGCEAYLTESELVGGKCPFHPTQTPKKVSEKNYFFALSKYQTFLLDHIKKNPKFIVPENKKAEIVSFIKSGLSDFSVSRKNVSWGIPVPDDPEHTIYVWFDALINYLTYGVEKKCWPANVHVLGKDNQRFHAIYWPAMLKSAGYELPKTILVHDFFSLNGQKISKSLGNIIKPSQLTEKYGADAVRYHFLRYGPLRNDVDITIEKLDTIYNADLANGLGNLTARIAKLCEKAEIGRVLPKKQFDTQIAKHFENFRVDLALEEIWSRLRKIDQKLNIDKPWEIKNQSKLSQNINLHAQTLVNLVYQLTPFIPDTAEKIIKQYAQEKIKSSVSLFPRI